MEGFTTEQRLQAVLAALEPLRGRGPLLLAVDGRCGAGKTTLAAALQARCGAAVVHMDDFFLRPEQRTAERYAAPGENVDHERFLAEVLRPLRAGEPALYRPFDCRTFTLGPARELRPAALTVVEGSYACHPELFPLYDLRVFLDVTPPEQLRRITERNGEEKAEEFRRRWIPLEEAYFAAFDVARRCDLRL